MDASPLPKQTTLTQYSMSHISRPTHNSETRNDKEKQRNVAMDTVKKAIKSNDFSFRWKNKSRNKEITIHKKQHKEHFDLLQSDNSEDEFEGKLQHRYYKETHTNAPNHIQLTQNSDDSNNSMSKEVEDDKVPQIVKRKKRKKRKIKHLSPLLRPY